MNFLEIAAIIGGVMSVIGFITWASKTTKKATQPIFTIRAAVKVILRYCIARTHREYMEAGQIDRYGLTGVHELHIYHKALGGDGMFDDFLKDIDDLPVVNHKK